MANQRRIYVETPRGRIVNVHHRDGTISMELQWNPGFSTRANKNFNDVQGYIDSTVIRFMTPYTPMRNGILYSHRKRRNKTGCTVCKISVLRKCYGKPYYRLSLGEKRRKQGADKYTLAV